MNNNNTVVVKSLYKVGLEELDYQTKIATGVISPTDSGYRFINDGLLGGFNEQDICTIAALSSTGKSTLAIDVGLNICVLNKNTRVLFFSFEVPGRKIAGKIIAKKLKTSLRDMYINKLKAITQFDVDMLKDIPFDIVEIPLNIDKIRNLIDQYCNKYPNNRIHCIYDHTLLTENLKGDTDMDTLVAQAAMANTIKKQYPLVQIFISQLNDSLLKDDRMKRSSGNYPVQADIFGSRSIWHVSDYITCGVNPSRLNLPANRSKVTYGSHGLPLTVANKQGGTSEIIYWHNVKTRDSALGIYPTINELEFSTLTEFSVTDYNKFKSHYKL